MKILLLVEENKILYKNKELFISDTLKNIFISLLKSYPNPVTIASNEKGYKDCIHIPPNESVDILVKMTDYTDATGKYMYLEHEDAGMMGQFVVV